MKVHESLFSRTPQRGYVGGERRGSAVNEVAKTLLTEANKLPLKEAAYNVIAAQRIIREELPYAAKPVLDLETVQ